MTCDRPRPSFRLACLAAAALVVACAWHSLRADDVKTGKVTISAEFPGGNVDVGENNGETVQVAPDLRGDNPWFYWYFEATAVEAGRVRFVFPEKVLVKNGAIGYQGPAVSTDGGKTWRWMGTDTVRESTFHYDFAEKGDKVRFAVTIPYVEANLKQFLETNRKNPHLRSSVLTKSRDGRKVELLQIGETGPDKQALLVTARHHAAETMASYVVEGFLQEAMSESSTGIAFRRKYVLFAVPLVDKDGVEEGDQGKNRKPHDHNRDYSDKSIYPEIQAIKALHETQRFRYALDFHCPTLVLKDHQVIYFVGAKAHPPHNFENVSTFAERIKNGLPKTAPYGPLVWLRDEDDRAPKSSRYFGFQAGTVMSATLEFPFAPPGKATDPASCRNYGAVILQAFTDTAFRTAEGE